MRRVVIAVVLCLLLGLLTSIAVAWAAVFSFESSGAQRLEFKSDGWIGAIDRNEAVEFIQMAKPPENPQYPAPPPFGTLRNPTNAPAFVQRFGSAATSSTELYRIIVAGWPTHCVRSVECAESDQGIFLWYDQCDGGIHGASLLRAFDGPDSKPVTLPIQPIGMGLAANTAFFAAPLLAGIAILSLSRFAVQRHRRRSNRCIRCKYDISATPSRCPECGTDLVRIVPVVPKPSLVLAATLCGLLLASVVVTMLYTAIRPTSDRILRAAYHGDINALQELDENGVEWNRTYSRHWSLEGDPYESKLTPLDAAAAGGDLEAIQWLIDHGAEPDWLFQYSDGPIYQAFLRRQYDAAVLLFEQGATLSPFMMSQSEVVLIAAMSGDPAYIDLLDKHTDLDFAAQGRTLAHTILMMSSWIHEEPRHEGHAVCLERLIELGTPITVDAMGNAIRQCNADALRVLLEHGGDPNAKGHLFSPTRDASLLITAIRSDCEGDELARLLLEHGHDVDSVIGNGLSALAIAAESRPASTVRLLLKFGANPNSSSSVHNAPLYWGAVSGSAEKVRLLLDAGADPSVLSGEDLSFATPETRQLIEDAAEQQ